MSELQSELNKLIAAEQKLLEMNRLYVTADALDLCQHIEDAYDHLLKSYSGLQVSELQVVLLQFIAGSKLEVATGILALLRGQRADAHGHARKAIEHVLFGINLFERKFSAKRWLMCANSQQAFKDYRDEFIITDMLHISTYETLSARNRSIAQELIGRYEMFCLSVHPTPWAQGAKLSTVSPEGELGIWLYLVDQQPVASLLNDYFFALGTHVQILSIFADLVNQTLEKFDTDAWSELVGRCEQKHKMLFERHRSDTSETVQNIQTVPFWQTSKNPTRKKTRSKGAPRAEG